MTVVLVWWNVGVQSFPFSRMIYFPLHSYVYLHLHTYNLCGQKSGQIDFHLIRHVTKSIEY